MDNLEHMITIRNHCGEKVKDMVENADDRIWQTMADTPKEDIKKPFMALFMTFLTYLFTHEFIMLKRKDKNDTEDRPNQIR